MSKNRIIIVLAACVALLPLLGFPKAWESFFQVFTGFAIVVLSIWSAIDRKLKLQAKAQMRARKTVQFAESVTPLISNETSDFGKRVTDFYPKTGQPGRRITDLNPTIGEEGREN